MTTVRSLLSLGVLLSFAAGAQAQAPAPEPTILWSVSSKPDGSANLTGRAGELTIDQVTTPSGAFTVRLTRGADSVQLALRDDRTVVVTRGRETATFDPRARGESGLLATRALLARSPAALVLRQLGTAFERRPIGSDTPFTTMIMVDAALLSLLEGDGGQAMVRVAGRAATRSGVRMQAATYRLRRAQFRDCVTEWEIYQLAAWDVYWDCVESADNHSWYDAWIFRNMCALEYSARTASGMSQFFNCTRPSLP